MELPDDDRPPERIWKDDEALNAHFDALRDRYSSKGGGSAWEPVPQADEVSNELTAGLRKI